MLELAWKRPRRKSFGSLIISLDSSSNQRRSDLLPFEVPRRERRNNGVAILNPFRSGQIAMDAGALCGMQSLVLR
jgi:hypothetical protein